MGRDNSVVTAGRSGDRIPVWARISAPVQTGSGAHSTSHTRSTGSFPGVKRPGRGLHRPLHLASRLRKESVIPFWVFVACSGVNFTLTLTFLYLQIDSKFIEKERHASTEVSARIHSSWQKKLSSSKIKKARRNNPGKMYIDIFLQSHRKTKRLSTDTKTLKLNYKIAWLKNSSVENS